MAAMTLPLTIDIGLATLATLVLILEIAGVKSKRVLGWVSAAGLVAVGASGLLLLGIKDLISGGLSLWGGMYVLDPLACFFKALFLILAFIVVLISISYFEALPHYPGEYYALVLYVTLGLSMAVSAGDLVTLFLAVELISIPLYILAASLKGDAYSSEAGLKYFLLGALASGIMLYGMSLLYGLFGTTILSQISQGVAAIAVGGPGPQAWPPALVLALVFLAAGFSFKIAAVPFHMYAPDVYQGSPTPVTTLISTGPKAAGVAILIRIFLDTLGPMGAHWSLIFSFLAVFSMMVGNLSAIPQTDVKRLLAYSGIAQLGYVLVGLAAAGQASAALLAGQLSTPDLVHSASAAALFYIFLYALTNAGAFAVVALVARTTGRSDIGGFAGLSKRSPALAAVLFVAFLSLAGVPPFGGFIGKFYLFSAAFQAHLVWLVVIGVILSVVSLFYYLKVLRAVYFDAPPEGAGPIDIPEPYKVAFTIAVFAIVVLGLIPAFTDAAYAVAGGTIGLH